MYHFAVESNVRW